MKNNDSEFKEFFDGYVDAAMFTSRPDGPPAAQKFSNRALEIFEEDCRAFYDANIEALRTVESDMRRNGIDFWLTREGHGSGFWEHKYKSPHANLYDILDLAAKRCGECEVYIDDGVIEVYGR